MSMAGGNRGLGDPEITGHIQASSLGPARRPHLPRLSLRLRTRTLEDKDKDILRICLAHPTTAEEGS